MRSFIYTIVAIGLGAAACGCSTKAGAQAPTPPARMLTADTDINQLVGGTIVVARTNGPSQLAYQKVADGPLVLTDAFGADSLYALPAGQDCTLPDGEVVNLLDGTNGRYIAGVGALQGARVLIKAGEELCVSLSIYVPVPPTTTLNSAFSWSGFRPY